MTGIWAELRLLVASKLAYEKVDPDEIENLQAVLVDFTQSWMRRAYEAGHLSGAMSQMKEGEEYDVDESLDKHYAGTKFYQWIKEVEA